MSNSRAGFAETDPGVPGAGVGTRRPRCGPGACPRARPGCSLQPYSLAEREVPSAGQLASHTVSTPRAFRDRLAKPGGERGPPAMAGHGLTTQKLNMDWGPLTV